MVQTEKYRKLPRHATLSHPPFFFPTPLHSRTAKDMSPAALIMGTGHATVVSFWMVARVRSVPLKTHSRPPTPGHQERGGRDGAKQGGGCEMRCSTSTTTRLRRTTPPQKKNNSGLDQTPFSRRLPDHPNSPAEFRSIRGSWKPSPDTVSHWPPGTANDDGSTPVKPGIKGGKAPRGGGLTNDTIHGSNVCTRPQRR